MAAVESEKPKKTLVSAKKPQPVVTNIINNNNITNVFIPLQPQPSQKKVSQSFVQEEKGDKKVLKKPKRGGSARPLTTDSAVVKSQDILKQVKKAEVGQKKATVSGAGSSKRILMQLQQLNV